MSELKGLDLLCDQNHFTESDVVQQVHADCKRANNPVLAFVEDCCRLGEDASSSKDTL